MPRAANPPITRSILLFFALPAVLQGFMHAPALSLVQGIYAKETALSLTAIGVILTATRIFDAVTDPAIGAMSDAWFRRTGSRKSFVIAGTFVNLVGLWFLYRPPPDVSIAYFTLWSIVYYFGWSLTEIPYRAWSVELTSDHVQRNRVQVWAGVALMTGTCSFYFVPYVGQALGATDSTALDFRSLALSAAMIMALAPIFTALAVWRVPDGEIVVDRRKVPIRELWRALRGNAPLIRFTVALLGSGLLASLSQGAYFLFADTYLGIGQYYAMAAIAILPATFIAIPFWGFICGRFERHHVWAVATTLGGLLMAGLGFLPKGEASALPFMLLVVSTIFMISALVVLAPAVLGDIVDYGRWKFHEDYAATYMAIYSLVQKFVAGVGVGASLLLLGAFGYDAAAPIQTAGGALGMKLAVSWLPALGLLLLAPFLWRFPIDRATHARMIAEIQARKP
jgi:Na+/melibiose symporter-like transporter